VSHENLTDVAVIVVGLNACNFVRDSFKSVYEATWNGCSFEAIYIDNGSKDNSLEMMAAEHPRVKVIANPDNRGFCIAANQGARAANSRYYFFLNDDTIVYDDAIARLAEFMDAHPEVGTTGSRLLNTDGTDQWSGRRFPSMLNGVFGRRSILSRWFPRAKPVADYLYQDEVARGEPFRADWVSAAAQLVRSDTFHEIGGYAENYYYWHEAIFCDRIRHAGKEVYLHPQSKIMHYEGQGSGKRPYAVRKWHIVNFHKGAYRAYCEHFDLGSASPRRYIVGALLWTRAGLLLAANWISHVLERIRPSDARRHARTHT